MRKMFIAVVLALMIIAMPLSPAMAQSDQTVIDEVFDQTESVRGLKALVGIAVNFMSRDQLQDRMLKDLEEENPEEEIKISEEIMVMMGFADQDLDLEQLYVDLYTEQVAGFYDPEDDSLYLISGKKAMNSMDKYILSHELTHYLQDQNYDLMRPPFHDPEDVAEETDDDASFAATCLIEGDAMITSNLWLYDYADIMDMMDSEVGDDNYSTDVYDSAPYYIQDALMFPYEEGLSFVEYIHGRGGFAAVDEAYSNIPSTTEYIMHPEKYVEGEPVIEVDLPDLTGDLGSGWELAYENVLGEFDVMELFKPYLSKKNNSKASEGWGGNEYQYYRDGSGEKMLVQGYAWDSEDDAEEFASAMVTYIEDRFEGEVEEKPAQGAWLMWSAGDYLFALKRDGSETYVVQATSEKPFKAVVGALGDEGSTIDKEAINDDAVSESDTGEEKDYYWLVVGGVIGLLAIGIVLVILMLALYRRPPKPPAQPPGGPYIYPGGDPGGGYGGPPGAGPAGIPWGGGGMPPPPPAKPVVPPPPET
ncbi:MAG: hypothetical protein SWK76_17330 [Actinomycetota bacterium]|nr:hypothetical protein [Actinomycetota bacterium]